jgi:hypothetical protein
MTGLPDRVPAETSDELRVVGRLDRRRAEALFLELRSRARQLGFDLELVSVGPVARADGSSHPDA